MEPYIEFVNLSVNLVVTVWKGAPLLMSILVAIPFVSVGLFIGWRKGFVGLKGAAIGVGVLGLVGVFVYLSGQPPSPGARGSFQWPELQTDNRCDSDSDCTLTEPVRASCCLGCPSSTKLVYSTQQYNELREKKSRICAGFDRKKCPRHKCQARKSKSKSIRHAKCVEHQCTLVEKPWTKAATGGMQRSGKGKAGKRKAGKQWPRAKRGKHR